MEKNNKQFIRISEETQIDRPANREMFAVEKIDWERLKKLIGNIDTSSSKWENAGWVFLTITIGFVIAAFDKDQYKMHFFIAAFFSFVITCILFFVAWLFLKKSKKSEQEVLFEMGQMEPKVAREEGKIQVQSGDLEVLEARYGSSQKSIDIAQNLNDNIKNNKLSMIVSNEIAGDPDVGIVKSLKIRYRYQGREYERLFQEGGKIDLP